MTPEPPSDRIDLLEERAEALTEALKSRARAEAELRRSRNLLSLAVETAGVGTWVYDGEAEDIEADARWFVLHGLRERPRTLGELYAEIQPEHREMVSSALDAVFSGAQVHWDGEYETQKGRWILSRMHRMSGADAGIIIGTAIDITAQRKTAEDLRERIDLQELLVGVASHDLKTPLMTVSTALDLLDALGPLTPEQKRAAQKANHAVDRANRLVLDLLDVTRHRLCGDIPMNPERFDLGLCLREVVSAARLRGGEEASIDLELEGDLELRADRSRVVQVFSNLLDNALAHAEPAALTVRASTRGDELIVAVCNPGPPIEPEALAHVFEPFQRGHQDRASRRNLGLGLHIVHLLVTQHGGTVQVSSDAAGTTFTTCWPRSGPGAPSSADEDPPAT